MTIEHKRSSKGEIEDLVKARYSLIWITSPEENRVEDSLKRLCVVRELRALVQALHGAGLRVGMDVVYNHTSDSGQHAQSVLDRIVPGYYHRLDADGRVERSTCCENTATEHAMMARLMIDSAVIWARDYRIDSFRFDLMGHQPRVAMEALQVAVDRAAGRHIDLIGEGWNFGEVADGARFVQASQQGLGGSGIATFSDRARDAVRGGGCCDKGEALVARQGWVNGQHVAPNARASASRADLLRSADLVRVGLAGSLRTFELETADGEIKTLARIDYDGQPAGYAEQPGEVVNYVENHDNPTLFDINVLKLPLATTAAERARVQMLALAVPALSQGIAYYHAGSDLLRSKSLDRNSFDSGDWFNRIDWSGRAHAFGSGLPRAADNGADWALLRPFLADTSIRPGADVIAWTRGAFLDLLRLRASTPLLRLRSAEDVRRRLRFHATGPAQPGALIAATIDGAGMHDAGFAELAYFINADLRAHTVVIGSARGKAWQLHPVQRAATAVDARPRDESRVEMATGSFHIPPRSVVVYVVAGPSAQTEICVRSTDSTSRNARYSASTSAVGCRMTRPFRPSTITGSAFVT
jgi:pullulanase-type alpha-1,6-glucosidase